MSHRIPTTVPQFAPWLGQDEYRALESCFAANWITEGPEAAAFIAALLELTGARYGVLAPNGTLALYLGLRALGIGPGDEVLVPDFTMIASATAVEMTGARPVFVDVNRRNFQIDVTRAATALGPRVKAIMPVHMYGTVADMPAVLDFARRHDLRIVEDAAQAIGAHRGGQHAGTFGDVGCFSFFADKTITTGEGGFVVTDDEATYRRLTMLRNMGREHRGTFIHPEIGYNLRLTDLQCAIGRVQLVKLPEIRERKCHILRAYQRQLADTPGVRFPLPDAEADWIPFRVAVLHDSAHALIEHLTACGIEARTFFYPLHRQPCFRALHEQDPTRYGDDHFPNSIYAYEHGLLLPTFPALTDDQITRVCDAIKAFC